MEDCLQGLYYVFTHMSAYLPHQCLNLVEALIRGGVPRCIGDFRSERHTFDRLTHFEYINTKGEDCGANGFHTLYPFIIICLYIS